VGSGSKKECCRLCHPSSAIRSDLHSIKSDRALIKPSNLPMAMRKKGKRSTLTMTTFFSVVTFRRCDDQKMEKINVLRFLRKKTYCHKCLNISNLELELI
jgi:hypothetical protein